jgi:NAD(P)H dehydrogenase (quinone)
MIAITGITGKVGGELARHLLAAGERVRAVVRDPNKGQTWASLGCDVALADMEDRNALGAAFSRATAVFVLPPPVFDPEPGYPEVHAVIESVTAALRRARPEHVLCLSTIGADARQDNLLSQRGLMEAALRALEVPLTVLRPAWFMDNAAWDVASARDTGLLHSFLQPTQRAIPMVAARDVGRCAAALIRDGAVRLRIVELEGPSRTSPDDLAAAFSGALGKPVSAVPVPRAKWAELFRAQGMRHPEPRMRMLDGFNEGWIEFADGGLHTVKGTTSVNEVIASLVHADTAT